MRPVTAARRQLRQPESNWISTEDAADLLCVERTYLLKVQPGVLRRTALGEPGKSARRHGYVWWKPDIEDLARLRKGAHLSLNVALRVLAAIDRGEFPNLMRRRLTCVS